MKLVPLIVGDVLFGAIRLLAHVTMAIVMLACLVYKKIVESFGLLGPLTALVVYGTIDPNGALIAFVLFVASYLIYQLLLWLTTAVFMFFRVLGAPLAFDDTDEHNT